MAETSVKVLQIDDLSVFVPGEDRLADVVAYVRANRQRHAKWFQSRGASYYTEEFWARRLVTLGRDYEARRALPLVLVREPAREIVANVSFRPSEQPRQSFITGGIGRHAKIDSQRVLRALIVYTFEALAVEEIVAMYSPDNKAVARLLAAVGFSISGLRQMQPIGGVVQGQIVAVLREVR